MFFVDDGKLFQGSGVGDPFGPRCFEGDIMGCGIMFPRDYSLDGGGEHLVCGLRSPVSHLVQSLTVFLFFSFFFYLLDDIDDWDLEVFPKPSEVQNDLYANNEDEEDEGEDVEGKKVAVRCCQNFGISKQGTPKAFSANIFTIPLLCPCV